MAEFNDSNLSDYDPRIDEAKNFLKLANDADTMNRQEALEDLKFVNGDQWPVELQNSRNLESRPVLTINKLDGYCRQVVNQIRQQRPRPKVHGMNSQADEKTAQVIQGIIRHIEANSNAENAYDTATDFAVRIGLGYIRLRTDYVDEQSFDQEIYIEPIDNPFTVYYDINSVLPDGSDAERCLITTMMRKADFSKMYPDAEVDSFTQRGTGDSQSEWITKEDIRLAEYYYTVRERAKLYLLSDGTATFADDKNFFKRLEMAGIEVIDQRESVKKTIKWCKVTAIEVLEEGVWAGKYLPIIPVYGRSVIIGDKRKRFGMVRHAKDAQRMYNFWQTSLTESVALAPKAKWIMAEGQDEGHEMDWAQANIKSFPLLRYKQTDIEGRQAPPPQRLQPEPPPAGIIESTALIDQDIKVLMGVFDPAQLKQGNISGKALNGQMQQVDLNNFDFYDNLCKSQAQVARSVLDLIPKIYDTQRVMRIIGDDGKPELITVNEFDAVNNVMKNDLTVGLYDVVMDTGPGYNSKRQEALETITPILSQDPQLMAQIGDLWFRNMDFPGADIIADRLATLNPLSKIDEKSDVPPRIQMAMAQAQQQVQQMQQQMQQMQMAMKQRQDIEQVKQQAETQRELMRQTAKAHNTETMAEVKIHDQATRSITSQNKVEIEAIMELLLHHMDTKRLEREIASRNAEQSISEQQAAQSVGQTFTS
jgi:Phage P22-like portal protein